MRMRSLLLLSFCGGLLLLGSGCGTIYSRQSYGAPAMQSVSAGLTKSEVFANLGQPNVVYKTDSGEVFVYKYSKGSNILGLYSTIKREDTVVVMDAEGKVSWVSKVDVGNGMTILSPPMLDATHPVHTDTLLFAPENYEYVYEGSEE